MKRRLILPLAAFVLGGVAFAPPLHAQSGRVVVGDAVSAAAQGPQGYPQRYPYPSQRQQPYPQPYPGGEGSWGRYGADDYARSSGYSDGYEKGYDDARDRRAYEPRRHRRYRAGDNRYERGYYMSREQYKDVYRRGFMSGYDSGYRDGLRGGRGGYGYGQPGSYPYPQQPGRRQPRGGRWPY